MAAPSYIASTTSSAITGTTASIVLPDGAAGAQAGHFAVLVLSMVPGLPTTDMTALGWTALAGTPTVDTSSSGNLLVWTKTLTGGDLGATLNISVDVSSRYAMACLVTTAATLDASAVSDTPPATNVSVIAPSVTAVSASTLLVTIHGTLINLGGTTVTWTADAATTERVDVSSANPSGAIRNSTLLIATQTLNAAGATGTRTATASAAVQRQSIGLTLAGLNLGAVTFAANSTFTATATRAIPAAVTFAANSTFTATAVRVVPAAVTFAATSAMTATAVRAQSATLELAADSTFTATAVRAVPAAVTFGATSALTATAALNHLAAVTFAAGSTLTLDPERIAQYRPGVHTTSSSRPTLTATTTRG